MNNRAEPNLLLLESNYFINGRSRTGIKSLSAYVSCKEAGFLLWKYMISMKNREEGSSIQMGE